MHRRTTMSIMKPSACGTPSLSEKKRAQQRDFDRITQEAYHELYQQLLRDEHSRGLTPESVAALLESFRANFECEDARAQGLPIPLVILIRKILMRLDSTHGVTPAHKLASVLILQVNSQDYSYYNRLSQSPPKKGFRKETESYSQQKSYGSDQQRGGLGRLFSFGEYL